MGKNAEEAVAVSLLLLEIILGEMGLEEEGEVGSEEVVEEDSGEVLGEEEVVRINGLQPQGRRAQEKVVLVVEPAELKEALEERSRILDILEAVGEDEEHHAKAEGDMHVLSQDNCLAEKQ